MGKPIPTYITTDSIVDVIEEYCSPHLQQIDEMKAKLISLENSIKLINEKLNESPNTTTPSILNIDDMLINMAAIGIANITIDIREFPKRTSASDEAILILINKGCKILENK